MVGNSADSYRPITSSRLIRITDGEMHVTQDGPLGAPGVLLIHGAAASMSCWDAIVPILAQTHRVTRVDLLGHGRSSSPAHGYDIPTQARRVGEAMDRLDLRRLTVVGHSTGATVAAALAEHRPDLVAALAIIDMGPTPDAKVPERRLTQLLLTKFPGALLWRLRNEDMIRNASRSAFTRPIDIPDALVNSVMKMTHAAFAGTMRAPLTYLAQENLPDRLSVLGLPLLVIFGADDKRWRSSSAAAYKMVPGSHVELLAGVGHTPPMEDPSATGKLLLDFAEKQKNIQPGAYRG